MLLATCFPLFGLATALSVTNHVNYDDDEVRLSGLSVKENGELTSTNAHKVVVTFAFENEGLFIIKADKDLTKSGADEVSCQFSALALFENKGMFSLDYLKANAVLDIAIDGEDHFSNSGVMEVNAPGVPNNALRKRGFWGALRPNVMFLSRSHMCNTGNIVLSGSPHTPQIFEMATKDAGKKGMENSGTICLFSTKMKQKLSIGGSGHIVVAEGSALTLSNKYQFSSGQTIFLSPCATQATIFFKQAPDKGKTWQTLRVLGLRQGAFLKFSILMLRYSYDYDTVSFFQKEREPVLVIHIGTHYDPDLFVFDGNLLTYKTDFPVEIPSGASCAGRPFF